MKDKDAEDSLLDRLFLRPADERIYAVVRIGFSLVALINVIHLWTYGDTLMGNNGMIDAEAIRAFLPWFDRSVFELASGQAGIALIFLISAVAIVLLGLGVYPRAAALWVFIWHVSVTDRIGIASTGWDLVLQSFSFLVLVSPLGRCWSLNPRKVCGEVLNYGLTLMKIQVFVIYLHTNLARLTDELWIDGSYLYYFVQSHHSRFPYQWWVTAGEELRWATWATILLEILIPFLLVFRKTRWAGIGLGIFVHGGIVILAHSVAIFSLAMAMTWLAFLRSPDMDRISRWSRKLRQGLGFRRSTDEMKG